MFDFGFSELVVIALVALIVLGPKRLPEAARTAGRWVGRTRRFLENVKQDFDREVNAGGQFAELKKLQEELAQTRALVERQVESTTAQLSYELEEDRVEPSGSTPKQPPEALPPAADKKHGGQTKPGTG